MVEMESEDLRLMLEAGFLYLNTQRFDEAVTVFEGVSFLASKSEVPLVGLGNVYLVQYKFDEAIKFYLQALKLAPESAFVTAYLGEAYLFKGKKEQALETLNKASLADPEGKSGAFARALLDLIAKGFGVEGLELKPEEA